MMYILNVHAVYYSNLHMNNTMIHFCSVFIHINNMYVFYFYIYIYIHLNIHHEQDSYAQTIHQLHLSILCSVQLSKRFVAYQVWLCSLAVQREELGTLARYIPTYSTTCGLYHGCIEQYGVLFGEQPPGYPPKGIQNIHWLFCFGTSKRNPTVRESNKPVLRSNIGTPSKWWLRFQQIYVFTSFFEKWSNLTHTFQVGGSTTKQPYFSFFLNADTCWFAWSTLHHLVDRKEAKILISLL